MALPERPGRFELRQGLGRQGRRKGNVGAASHPREDQPIRLQVRISRLYGNAVDAQIMRQPPTGRQARSRQQTARKDALPQMGFDLLIKRNLTVPIERNAHDAAPLIGTVNIPPIQLFQQSQFVLF